MQMVDDPYQTLGVARDATPEQIRLAYRRLAKQCHPDLHPGNTQAEARFKTVAAAYGSVSGPRARYERGRIDGANTVPGPYGFWYPFAAEVRDIFLFMADIFLRGMS